MKKVVWYVGGKSAGHIIPLITCAQREAHEPVFITTHRDLDKQLVQSEWQGAIHCALYLPDFHRKKFWLYPWYILTWFWAFMRLAHLYYKTRPVKIFSTGGLTAIPVFLFGFCMGIPRELFELNAIPGDAVMFLRPLSNHIFYCYKAAASFFSLQKSSYKAYPIRPFKLADRMTACSILGLDSEKKTICFLGGSQGSHFINTLACQVIGSYYAPQAIQIIHQAGRTDLASLRTWYATHGYRAYVVDFSEQIEIFYSAADVVICRAGAGTLWELATLAVPTCVIPLHTQATDHQVHNARALCAEKPQQFIMIGQTDDAQHEVACCIKQFFTLQSADAGI